MTFEKFEPKRLDANYQDHDDLELNGNPLTASLQVLENENIVLERLTHIPVMQSNFWQLSNFYKKTQLSKLLDIFIPHSKLVPFLYYEFMEQILCNYKRRNPFSANQNRLTMAIAEKVKKEEYLPVLSNLPGMTTAQSSLISGVSGVGKTLTIRNVLSLIPQVIDHIEYQGKPFNRAQIVWLSFDCPATASPKALALSFFRALDTALGEPKYAPKYQNRDRIGVEHLYGLMQQLATKYHIGLIHFDELQFFLKFIKSPNSPNLQIIESLFNKLGIPVFLSCTPEGTALFDPLEDEPNEMPKVQTLRRMISEREDNFKPYKAGSKEFDKIFDAFYQKGICINGITPSDEFKAYFHYLTGGLQSIITRLARLHIKKMIIRAANDKRNVARIDDKTVLDDLFKRQFHRWEPALKHLRNNNLVAFEQAIPTMADGRPDYSDYQKKSSSSASGTTSEKSLRAPTIKGSKPKQDFDDDDFISGGDILND
ncbi:ATP-binding protein [Thalassotalea sp. SU-HH00458]|uniref:ATP-binding protein n=1 Tax=Thalassotalea sp. SU-HH00458 TaxID=3127657 RepID=UPI003107CB24